MRTVVRKGIKQPLVEVSHWGQPGYQREGQDLRLSPVSATDLLCD